MEDTAFTENLCLSFFFFLELDSIQADLKW